MIVPANNDGASATARPPAGFVMLRSEEHTSELQSHSDLVCRLLLEKKKRKPKSARVSRVVRPRGPHRGHPIPSSRDCSGSTASSETARRAHAVMYVVG